MAGGNPSRWGRKVKIPDKGEGNAQRSGEHDCSGPLCSNCHNILSNKILTTMVNPRQRRKARSGSSTKPSATAKRHIRKKLVRAPTVKGPDILREQWDGKKTVRQNYEALGLVADAKLRPSGGMESRPHVESSTLASQIASSSSKGMGRIVRDEQENVVDVILHDDEEAEEDETTPWGKSMRGWEDKEEETDRTAPQDAINEKSSSRVVQALEAMPDPGPLPRHVSQLEAHWILSLVRKHGRDVDAMFGDRKLNELQKTKGEIRSRQVSARLTLFTTARDADPFDLFTQSTTESREQEALRRSRKRLNAKIPTESRAPDPNLDHPRTKMSAVRFVTKPSHSNHSACTFVLELAQGEDASGGRRGSARAQKKKCRACG